MSSGKTAAQTLPGWDRTVHLIEALYARSKQNALILNPDYLDDEKLPEEERTAVLKEIFNRRIREKQLERIEGRLERGLLVGFPRRRMLTSDQ